MILYHDTMKTAKHMMGILYSFVSSIEVWYWYVIRNALAPMGTMTIESRKIQFDDQARDMQDYYGNYIYVIAANYPLKCAIYAKEYNSVYLDLWKSIQIISK